MTYALPIPILEAGTKPASARLHRSTAYVKGIGERGRDPITAQFRFVIRMAHACHEHGIPYSVTWGRHESTMRATITATGAIPMPKPLPKPPKPKLVAAWKPAIWDAVYRLDAYHDANLKHRCPGFVIEHSCGLALVHPSDSGELGITAHGGDEDIRQNWLVTHAASGMGFGLRLTFKRATDALLLAASFPVDWTQPADALKSNPECKRAGNTVIATYGKSHERDTAKAPSRRAGVCSMTLTDLTRIERPSQEGLSRSPLEQAREFARRSKAENTLRGYRADWRDFCAWCERQRLRPLPAPPETVAAYIAECAGWLKVGSIQRRLNAIAEAHKAMGADSPTPAGIVRATLKGIRRTLGTAATQKAAAITADILAMLEAADAGLIGLRDRALVLLGFAGAFRRSELVGLDVADLTFSRDGLTVTLHRSKTDQDSAGRKIGIPYGANPDTCPVRVLQTWLEEAGIGAGPVFRSVNRHGRVQPGRLSPEDVARVVKKLAQRAGLDPAKYAGHSLRAGHATTAAIAGASERSIMAQTGHRSVQMVRRYIRDGSLFRENSAGKLGL